MKEREKPTLVRRLGAIGGIATAVAALVGLALLFWPNLNPLSAHAGEIESVEVTEYNVPNGGYVGIEYAVQVHLKGYNGKKNPVRYTVRSVENGTALSDMVDEPAFDHISEGQDETATGEAWVPIPPTSGDYYVEFILYDNDGETVLDRDTSPEFSS